MRRFIILLTSTASLIWSGHTMLNLRVHVSRDSFTSGTLKVQELSFLIHLCVSALALWITGEVMIDFVRQRRFPTSSLPDTSNKFRFLLLSGLALTSHQPMQASQPAATHQQDSVPVSLLLTPAMATLLLRDILHRRREQIRLRRMPDVLTLDESACLSEIQIIASHDSKILCETELDYSLSVVQELTSAVERIDGDVKFPSSLEEEPLMVVRLYGYPEVCGREGRSASFRKKRSLELIVWLSLNRDRSRRSAARTALWQVDVSDSSFSTIVSDMRRGISEVVPSVSRSELVPTTYSDELILSSHVTTDYELLRLALEKFRKDPGQYRELMHELGGVRDAPFSGTTYEWADLDGTTTRLIITAMQAAQELAEYGFSIGDVEVMSTAVAAGLRVMPGNEELLAIQNAFVPRGSFSKF
jgi:hypothetical protein